MVDPAFLAWKYKAQIWASFRLTSPITLNMTYVLRVIPATNRVMSPNTMTQNHHGPSSVDEGML